MTHSAHNKLDGNSIVLLYDFFVNAIVIKDDDISVVIIPLIILITITTTVTTCIWLLSLFCLVLRVLSWYRFDKSELAATKLHLLNLHLRLHLLLSFRCKYNSSCWLCWHHWFCPHHLHPIIQFTVSLSNNNWSNFVVRIKLWFAVVVGATLYPSRKLVRTTITNHH